MGSGPQNSARSTSTDRLERPVVRLVVATAALMAAAMWILALALNEEAFLIHALASAFMAFVGMAQVALRREHTYSLVMIATATVALNVTLNGSPALSTRSVVTLTVLGIGSTIFATRPRLHIAAYSVFLVLAIWAWHGGELVFGLVEGITVGMVFAIGAGVIDWIRVQADSSAAGYEHLFKTAPVSLWREDFSQVHNWMVWLRSAGVTDLAGYLDEDPTRIAQAAGLIVVTEVNDAAVRLLEADGPNQLVGRLDPHGMTEASRASLRDQLLGVWDGRSSVVTEVRNGRTLEGNRLEGLLSFSAPMVDGIPDYSDVTVAIVDVTEGRLARAQLEDLVVSKDELVAAVSHELRTPLTAVVGLAGELAENLTSFAPDEIEEFIRLIAAQSEDVSLIVEDLLVAAQAETGSIHSDPEAMSVPEQIGLVLDGFRTDVIVPVELPQPIGRAWADPARVRQVIRNLVTNAKRYGSAPVRIVVRSSEDHVIIEVRDSGPELAPDQQAEIFNRYQRAIERPGVAASLGVGLTVSRELARVMGGDLTYAHDGETVFALTLPKWTGAEDNQIAV